MTSDQFRKLALALPEAAESAHMGHPDFRVGNKIFASLGFPNSKSAMVKLAPDQQAQLMVEHSKVFSPAAGAWGTGGATIVHLPAANSPLMRSVLLLAWRNTAPNKLLQQLD
jgi:hypothetical protein